MGNEAKYRSFLAACGCRNCGIDITVLLVISDLCGPMAPSSLTAVWARSCCFMVLGMVVLSSLDWVSIFTYRKKFSMVLSIISLLNLYTISLKSSMMYIRQIQILVQARTCTWLIVYTNTTVLSYALINADSCILFIISWCRQPFNH